MPRQRKIRDGSNDKPGIRNPTGPRKFGGNKQQQAQIKELNKKISDRKSYYKRKYGDTTLLEVETKTASSFTYLKDYNAYIKKIQSALTKEITPTHIRNKHKTFIPIDDVNQAKKEFKRINQMKKERRKELDKHGVLYGGKLVTIDQAIAAGDKRFEDLNSLKFNLDSYRTSTVFYKRMEELKETYKGDFLERWGEDYRGSYLEAMKRKIGVYSELGTDYTRLKNHIENMNIKDFMKFYYTREFTNINFLYDKTQAKLKMNRLLSEWDVPETDTAA